MSKDIGQLKVKNGKYFNIDLGNIGKQNFTTMKETTYHLLVFAWFKGSERG